MAETQLNSNPISPSSTVASAGLGTSHVAQFNGRPLTDAASWDVWSAKIKDICVLTDSWDPANDCPKDTASNRYLIGSTISDENYKRIIRNTTASVAWKKLQSLYKSSIKVWPISMLTQILNMTSFSTNNLQRDATEFDSIFSQLETSLGNPGSISLAHLKGYIMISLLPNQLTYLKRELDETIRKDPGKKDEVLSFSHIRERASHESLLVRRDETSFALKVVKGCPHGWKDYDSCFKCHPELRPTCTLCKAKNLKKYRHKTGGRNCPFERHNPAAGGIISQRKPKTNLKKTLTKTRQSHEAHRSLPLIKMRLQLKYPHVKPGKHPSRAS